jgi:hypothetical protein
MPRSFERLVESAKMSLLSLGRSARMKASRLMAYLRHRQS